jgi:hypothetical protein
MFGVICVLLDEVEYAMGLDVANEEAGYFVRELWK